MRNLDPKNLDTAFVPSGTPMFSNLIERLSADTDLSPNRARDLKSGLCRVAKALGRPAETIPADPKWLQPRLERIAPASLGLTSKSWSNVLSDARAALAYFGVVRTKLNRQADLSEDWKALWKLILASKDPTLSSALCRFVHYLNRQGVQPEFVTDDHARAYRDALALNVISKAPDISYRAAVNGWNLAVRRLPEWPQQTLSLASRQRRTQLPLSDFQESFREEFEIYLRSLEHADPFSENGRLTPLRPATVEQYRLRLHRFASILVHSGMNISEIRGIADLVEPGNTERGLKWMHEQNGGKTSPSISTTACLLKQIGKTYLDLPDEQQATLDRFAARLTPEPQRGMTLKNRLRLRAFDDKSTLRRFLSLPDQLFEQANRRGDHYRAQLLREAGLAIAILQHCPIRLGNLSEIHLDQNVQRPGDGRTFLVFKPHSVKNKQPIEFELPSSVVKMIEEHLRRRSPRLCPSGTPWLFPKRDGSKPINTSQLSSNVCKAIKREVGIEFNMHLFRHLAAKLWLESHPGQYEVVRRLLGHSELSRTLDAYAGFEAGTATKLFSDVITAGRSS